MAVLEKGTAYKKTVAPNYLRDAGNLMLNNLVAPIEGLTGQNFFDPKYTTGLGEKLGKGSDILGGLAGKLAPAALNFIPGVGPIANKALSAVGSAAGSMIAENKNPDTTSVAGGNQILSSKWGGGLYANNTSPYYTYGDGVYAMGGQMLPTNVRMSPLTVPQTFTMQNNMMQRYHKEGGLLTHYNGNKHEYGGIPIRVTPHGGDEVEDDETSFNKFGQGGEEGSKFIFSDSIFMPKKNGKGFSKVSMADESKRIEKKYSRRPGDTLAKNAQELELNKLSEFQESLKQYMGKGQPAQQMQQPMAQQVNPQMQQMQQQQMMQQMMQQQQQGMNPQGLDVQQMEQPQQLMSKYGGSLGVGHTLDLTPQQIINMRKQGYEFNI